MRENFEQYCSEADIRISTLFRGKNGYIIDDTYKGLGEYDFKTLITKTNGEIKQLDVFLFI